MPEACNSHAWLLLVCWSHRRCEEVLPARRQLSLGGGIWILSSGRPDLRGPVFRFESVRFREAGATYRMLERVAVRSTSDLASSELFKARGARRAVAEDSGDWVIVVIILTVLLGDQSQQLLVFVSNLSLGAFVTLLRRGFGRRVGGGPGDQQRGAAGRLAKTRVSTRNQSQTRQPVGNPCLFFMAKPPEVPSGQDHSGGRHGEGQDRLGLAPQDDPIRAHCPHIPLVSILTMGSHLQTV